MLSRLAEYPLLALLILASHASAASLERATFDVRDFDICVKQATANTHASVARVAPVATRESANRPWQDQLIRSGRSRGETNDRRKVSTGDRHDQLRIRCVGDNLLAAALAIGQPTHLVLSSEYDALRRKTHAFPHDNAVCVTNGCPARFNVSESKIGPVRVLAATFPDHDVDLRSTDPEH